MLTRGDKNNREYVGETVIISDDVSKEMQSALFDPQTAGGLLISIPAEGSAQVLNEVRGAVIIGRVTGPGSHLIEVN